MSQFVFFNVWQTESTAKQQALVEAMRSEAPALATKRGFIGLSVWSGQDGDHRVIVEGRWQSREAFESAVTRDPAALQSRARLEQHGQSSPGRFVQSLYVVAPPAQP